MFTFVTKVPIKLTKKSGSCCPVITHVSVVQSSSKYIYMYNCTATHLNITCFKHFSLDCLYHQQRAISCNRRSQKARLYQVIFKMKESNIALFSNCSNIDRITTETGRLFLQRRAKQLLLSRNIFELSPRGI